MTYLAFAGWMSYNKEQCNWEIPSAAVVKRPLIVIDSQEEVEWGGGKAESEGVSTVEG